MSIQFEHPLRWPLSIPRTERSARSRFETKSISYAGDMLLNELTRLGGKNVIVTSNLQTRSRGEGFLSNQKVNDVGVAVYLDLKGKPKVFCCDKWDRVEHNVWALYLNVQAIRGIERWGGSNFLDGMFTGFAALPSPDMVQNSFFSDCHSVTDLKEKYRELCKQLHPDKGGSQVLFSSMTEEYSRRSKELGGLE